MVATHCNTLQHTNSYRNTLIHVGTLRLCLKTHFTFLFRKRATTFHISFPQKSQDAFLCASEHISLRCRARTFQHAKTHFNPPPHTDSCHTIALVSCRISHTLQHAATHHNPPRHTAAHGHMSHLRAGLLQNLFFAPLELLDEIIFGLDLLLELFIFDTQEFVLRAALPLGILHFHLPCVAVRCSALQCAVQCVAVCVAV